MWRRQLESAALASALAGWVCAILTRCLALWQVSGALDNQTASLPAYWDGVWLQWDDWDLAHDGSLHCSFYRALLSLSGSFRTWRALVLAAILVGAGAVLMAAAGALWFPQRLQVKVVSGGLFGLCAVLMLVPVAWTCHHTALPLEGALPLRRDWGPALYLGWISVALMLAGGAALVALWPLGGGGGTRGAQPSAPGPEDEADHPLSRIHRAAFTHSQYERGVATP